MKQVEATIPAGELLNDEDLIELCRVADEWTERFPLIAPVAERLRDLAAFEFCKTVEGKVGPTRLSLPLDDLTNDELLDFAGLVRERLEQRRASGRERPVGQVWIAISTAILRACQSRDETTRKLRELVDDDPVAP
jgi:hypothetical protein